MTILINGLGKLMLSLHGIYTCKALRESSYTCKGNAVQAWVSRLYNISTPLCIIMVTHIVALHCFKMNGYTFRGSNSVIFVSASFLSRGLLFPIEVKAFSNPIALRTAKTLWSFGCFECSRP